MGVRDVFYYYYTNMDAKFEMGQSYFILYKYKLPPKLQKDSPSVLSPPTPSELVYVFAVT